MNRLCKISLISVTLCFGLSGMVRNEIPQDEDSENSMTNEVVFFVGSDFRESERLAEKFGFRNVQFSEMARPGWSRFNWRLSESSNGKSTTEYFLSGKYLNSENNPKIATLDLRIVVAPTSIDKPADKARSIFLPVKSYSPKTGELVLSFDPKLESEPTSSKNKNDQEKKEGKLEEKMIQNGEKPR